MRSRTGVRTVSSLPNKRGGQKNGAEIPRPRLRLACRLVVVDAGLALHLLELLMAPTPLQEVLATHAGLDFRQGAQAGSGDFLTALDTDAVLAIVQAIEGSRDAVDPLHQQFAGGKTDLAPLIGLD